MTENRPVSIRGLVFDMDGLLLDSEKLVKRTWDYAGDLLGYQNFGDHIYHTVGFNLKRRTEYFHKHVSPDFPMEWFAETTRRKYHEIADAEGVEVKPGAVELLIYARKRGFRIGLATSSRRVHALQSLEKAQLAEYFDGMVTGDVVSEGKPDPEIYLRACRELGIHPREAAAFEDAPSGIVSAGRAGMNVIAVPDLVEPPLEVYQYIWHRLDNLGQAVPILEKYTVTA